MTAIKSLTQRRPVVVVNIDLDRAAVEDQLLPAPQDNPLEQTLKQFPVPARQFLFHLCENQEIASVKGNTMMSALSLSQFVL